MYTCIIGGKEKDSRIGKKLHLGGREEGGKKGGRREEDT